MVVILGQLSGGRRDNRSDRGIYVGAELPVCSRLKVESIGFCVCNESSSHVAAKTNKSNTKMRSVSFRYGSHGDDLIQDCTSVDLKLERERGEL